MRVVHCKKQPYTHYIGRPSLLGNPFSHKQESCAEYLVDTVEEAIISFEDYARESFTIMEAIMNLPEDAVLGCWCKPGPCHGDVIIKLWKEFETKHKENVLAEAK